MRLNWKRPSVAVVGILLCLTLAASAQAQPSSTHPSAAAQTPKAAQTAKPPAQAPMPSTQAPSQRVVIVEPIRVFDPFFDYPYPYAYPPDYMAANFGYVKIDTHRNDASVYVDGGFADKVKKVKKFALRPGNHEIELRDSDGRRIYHERVAVLVGKTTTLHVG